MDHTGLISKRPRARFRSARAVALGALLTLVVVPTIVAVAPPAHAAPEKAAPSAAAPLDINKATADELTALPGIGPAMARRIVEFRDEHGPFRRVEDLMRVKGIGEKSFEKLRPAIKVTEAG